MVLKHGCLHQSATFLVTAALMIDLDQPCLMRYDMAQITLRGAGNMLRTTLVSGPGAAHQNTPERHTQSLQMGPEWRVRAQHSTA